MVSRKVFSGKQTQPKLQIFKYEGVIFTIKRLKNNSLCFQQGKIDDFLTDDCYSFFFLILDHENHRLFWPRLFPGNWFPENHFPNFHVFVCYQESWSTKNTLQSTENTFQSTKNTFRSTENTFQSILVNKKYSLVFRKVVFGKPLSKLSCVCLPLGKLVNGKHFSVKGKFGLVCRKVFS